MFARVTGPGLPPLRAALAHPAIWSVPVVALLAVLAMPVNEGFYESSVNYDPQGDAQQHEWNYATRIFRHTSGVLCGQFVALLAGAALARRHAQEWALAMAVPLGTLLAGVTFAVAYPLARSLDGAYFATAPLDDPVLVQVLLRELAAYPLCAAAGVGLGALLNARRTRDGWRGLLVPLLVVGWFVATLTGLLQDDRFNAPYWLLWAVPPIAAGAAIALAGLSMDVWTDPGVLVGDWGRAAGTALLVSAAAYAVGLNVFGALAGRRRGRIRGETPAGSARMDG